METLQLWAVPQFPIISQPSDLPAIIETSLHRAGTSLRDGDIVVVAQKVVSKAEGRLVRLDSVTPTQRAVDVAAECDKDPRLVQLILDESTEVVRLGRGHLITRHRRGYVCANAGIDRSNAAGAPGEWACLLPEDPVGSAQTIASRLSTAFEAKVGVVISDSHGRPFRHGAIGVALAAVGFPPLREYKGRTDLFGYTLHTSTQAVADEVASAASLLMGQGEEGRPVVVVRGVALQAVAGDAGTAHEIEHATLVRPKSQDLFI